MKYAVYLKNEPTPVEIDASHPTLMVDDNGWLKILADDAVLLLAAAGEWVYVRKEPDAEPRPS